jgi:hypothetical protein
MSEFYDEMYEVARELLSNPPEGFGTEMVLTALDGTTTYSGRVAYLKPDRKRVDMPMETRMITNSNQRRAFFQFVTRDIFVPERGCRITSNGKTMTIHSVKPISPADEIVVYECLLEV